jgi:hypothetical protein
MNKFMSKDRTISRIEIKELEKKISSVQTNSKNNPTLFIKNNTNTVVFNDIVNICFQDKYNNTVEVSHLQSGSYIYTALYTIKVFININLNYLWINQRPPRYSFIIKQNNNIVTDMILGVYDYPNKVNTISEKVILDIKCNDIITIYLKKNIENESDFITINTNSFISFEKII